MYLIHLHLIPLYLLHISYLLMRLLPLVLEFLQIAPFDGIVQQIYVSPGDEVQANQLMLAIEPVEVEVADNEAIIIYS